MFKQSVSHRIFSMLLACMMLITFCVPASAMGFDDMATVVDMTGEDSSSSRPDTSAPDDDNGDNSYYPDPGDWDSDNSSSSAPADDDQEQQETSAATPTQAEQPSLGASGDIYTPLPNDSGVIYFGTNGIAPMASAGPNNIFYTADYSVQHVWPFDRGTTKYPIYKFYTGDGDTAYCIQPYKFNSQLGHAVTGELTYSSLSATQKTQIAKASEANPSGHSNTRMYAATQAIIWEICEKQSHRSGNIYSAVITANGLSSEYETIMSTMQSLSGEIPSFMSDERSAPEIHLMNEINGTWTITLTNHNSNVSFTSSDFVTTAALNFNANGNNLTVTSSQEPGTDSFVEWSAGDGGGGIIFWCNATIQDKATVNFVPGTGYMAFNSETVPPDIPPEEEPRMGYLTIYKYDGETNLPLGGAIFRIESETFSDDAWVVPYGGNTITFPIPEGKDSIEVTVTEVSSPHGYKLSGESKTVTVYANEIKELSEVAFDNYPEEATLVVIKHERGKKDVRLPGASFRLRYVMDGFEDIVETKVTGADGTITWNLPRGGRVELEELVPPDGYQLSDVTFWTFDIANGGRVEYEIPNDKNAELLVYKRDKKTHQMLGGALIEAKLIRALTEPYERDIVYQQYTQAGTGLAHFTNMVPGEYLVREVSPPAYYLEDSNNWEQVTVRDGSFETISITFENIRFGALTIIKADSTEESNHLSGAIFSLYEGVGTDMKLVASGETNENGMVVFEDLPSERWYTVVEDRAPYGFELSEDWKKEVWVGEYQLNQNLTVYFHNPPKPQLILEKQDEEGNPLPNAVFKLSKEGSIDFLTFESGDDGQAIIKNLEADVTYFLEEISAPTGFYRDTQKMVLKFSVGEKKVVKWVNKKLPEVTIFKYDQHTSEGIEGISFKFTRQDDGTVQYGTTGPGGILDGLFFEPGWIIIEEVNSLGYVLDKKPQEYLVEAGKDLRIEWPNIKRPTVTIRKLCSLTGQPLVAGFEVKLRDGRTLGTFWTDEETGEFTLDEELLDFNDFPLYFEILEVHGPDGYLITQEKHEFTLMEGQNYEYVWYNTPENPILIYKKDKDDQPIKGTEFEVTTVDGAFVARVKSGNNGYAVVGGVEPGWYFVRETKVSSDEFILDGQSQRVFLNYNEPAYVEFVNDRKPFIEIQKLSAGENPQPLQGVLMRVERLTGELIGDFRTDYEGKISLQVDPGWVRVYELESIPGFQLDQTPQIKELLPNTVTPFTFRNQAVPGYMLQKIDSVTKNPLEGVKYSITRLDGSIIGTGVHVTNEQGIIFLELDEPHIIVSEVATKEGYRLSSTPRTITLTPNELYIDKWENTPFPILELIKLDKESKNPLPNVKYKLFDQYMREVGIYKTNSLGRIVLTGMSEGKYYLQEYETSGPEYTLDKTVHEIHLYYGRTTSIELFNEKTGNVKIRKVSSEDSKPLSGATYLIYDEKNNVLFERTSDVYGWITLENMEPQRIYLREIKAPDNFVLDDALYGPYEIPSGGTLEITMKNTPEKGRIQIQKVSSGYNEITKDKEGAGLKSAKFDVYDNQMNLVDTIETDKNGYATTIDLPLGVYGLKERKSPDYFFTTGEMFYAEIKIHDDTIKFVVKNKPVDLEVSVEKRGVNETLGGASILYNLSGIENKSNVPLEEFFVHDKLPTEAVRLETVWTGVWSEREKFDFQIRTNHKGNWRTVSSNLLSTTNNEVDCSPSALGLASGEYVTEFRMIFKGEVQPGFKCTTGPAIQVKVLETVQNGQKFVNKVDVGGRYIKEWVYDTDGWTTTTYKKPRGDLPKTGRDIAPKKVEFS